MQQVHLLFPVFNLPRTSVNTSGRCRTVALFYTPQQCCASSSVPRARSAAVVLCWQYMAGGVPPSPAGGRYCEQGWKLDWEIN